MYICLYIVVFFIFAQVLYGCKYVLSKYWKCFSLFELSRPPQLLLSIMHYCNQKTRQFFVLSEWFPQHHLNVVRHPNITSSDTVLLALEQVKQKWIKWTYCSQSLDVNKDGTQEPRDLKDINCPKQAILSVFIPWILHWSGLLLTNTTGYAWI